MLSFFPTTYMYNKAVEKLMHGDFGVPPLSQVYLDKAPIYGTGNFLSFRESEEMKHTRLLSKASGVCFCTKNRPFRNRL